MKVSFRSYDDGPTKWIDIRGNTWIDAKRFIEKELRVFDTDHGGDNDEYVAVNIDGDLTYYKVHHEWYWVDDEDASYSFVENDFTYQIISKEEAKIPDERDWLDVSPFNYNLKEWPPRKIETL